jgi:hypothetical protein
VNNPLHHAVIVACHASFRKEITGIPESPFDDRHWVLEPFQRGEPRLYINHMQRAVSIIKNDPNALLIFSGGITHKDAGAWTEAGTYRSIAEHLGWWEGEKNLTTAMDLGARIVCEEFASDSFENLFFGMCRYRELRGHYPDAITLVSWKYKENRFNFHRDSLRIPKKIFHYAGVADPIDIQSALRGEEETLRLFRKYKYGNGGELLNKRMMRDPFNRKHPYRMCEGLESFFNHIDNPGNSTADYTGKFPWE